jgi:hypothetical protein
MFNSGKGYSSFNGDAYEFVCAGHSIPARSAEPISILNRRPDYTQPLQKGSFVSAFRKPEKHFPFAVTRTNYGFVRGFQKFIPMQLRPWSVHSRQRNCDFGDALDQLLQSVNHDTTTGAEPDAQFVHAREGSINLRI